MTKVEEYIKPMPNLTEFELLAQHTPEQLFRYAMDLNKQMQDPDAVTHWEQREPGSIKGVMDAYAAVICLIKKGEFIKSGAKDPIGVELIQLIQHHCLLNTTVDDPSTLIRGTIGQFRQTGALSLFKLRPRNTSDAGLLALIEEYKTYPEHLAHIIKRGESDYSNLERLKASISRDECVYQGSYNPGTTFQKLCNVGFFKPKIDYVTQNITNQIKHELETFTTKMALATTNDMKLRAIVELVQRVEHIHPFYDGNCRTLCMVLLNTLLIQYDFPPSLIDDPNKFDGFSTEELVSLVKQGIDQTKILCEFAEKSRDADAQAELVCADWILVNSTQYDKLVSYSESLIDALISPRTTLHVIDHPI